LRFRAAAFSFELIAFPNIIIKVLTIQTGNEKMTDTLNMIAIDPGSTNGGIAIALPGEGATAFKMPPTEDEIIRKLRLAKASESESAYLENIVLFTGAKIPGSRIGKYAANWGFLKGALMTLGFRVILVRPQKWQNALNLGTSRGMNKTMWKNKLKNEAARRFPHIEVTLATADALLILDAARQGALG
jgi:hypothetical protein